MNPKHSASHTASKAVYDHRISARVFLLFAVLAVTLLLSAYFYPAPFHHGIHSIGVGAAVVSLYFFTMTFYFELRPQVSPSFFWGNMLILQVVTFGYAFAFFLDMVDKQVYQKLCIFGIHYSLLTAASAGEEGFHLRDLWGRFGQVRR